MIRIGTSGECETYMAAVGKCDLCVLTTDDGASEHSVPILDILRPSFWISSWSPTNVNNARASSAEYHPICWGIARSLNVKPDSYR